MQIVIVEALFKAPCKIYFEELKTYVEELVFEMF